MNWSGGGVVSDTTAMKRNDDLDIRTMLSKRRSLNCQNLIYTAPSYLL